MSRIDRALEFMTQFYASASGGRAWAALRRKLQFLRSQLVWTHPYYWAGYLLTGNGREPPRVVPEGLPRRPRSLLLAVTAIRAGGKARLSGSPSHSSAIGQSAPTP
jgi:hypothetical protein